MGFIFEFPHFEAHRMQSPRDAPVIIEDCQWVAEKKLGKLFGNRSFTADRRAR
jgi:hypothetical protein